jgi:hypothetical protein
MIRALRDIGRNEELFFQYGDEYDWNAVKERLIMRCCEMAKELLNMQNEKQEWSEELASLMERPCSKKASEMYDLFDAVVNNTFGERILTDLHVLKYDDIMSWLGRVFDHGEIHKQVAFREADRPGERNASLEQLLNHPRNERSNRRNIVRMNMSEDTCTREV